MTATGTAAAVGADGVEELATHPLHRLFAPAGVAVIGASSDAEKLGGVMAASVSTYSGHVALVNSRENPHGNARGKSRAGRMHPTIGAAVEASPVGIDLAVLCVPAAVCADVITECGDAGVPAALVCAGGFAEAGGDGAEQQARLLVAARRSGVRLLGPNTSGFFAPSRGLLASFVPGVATLEPGPVGVVAASGGLNHALAFALQREGCGLSLGVGIGAGIDVAAPEVLDYLARDPGTRAIALHLESVTDGDALLAAVRAASSRKPVVASVVGRHDIGEFAASHTGALATSWRTTCALLRQAGAVVVDDVDELVVSVAVLSAVRARPAKAPAVGLVTAQAGPGLVVADALHEAGVRLPTLAAGTRSAIAGLLPPMTFQANPVDTGRPGPGHADVVSAVADDPAIDLVAVYALTEPVVDLVESARPATQAGHPVVVGIDGPVAEVHAARVSAAAAGVPLVVGPRALATAASALAQDARHRADRQAHAEEGTTRRRRPVALPGGGASEAAAKGVLDAIGIATPARLVCHSRDEARAALVRIGAPVAVKVSDPRIVHKSDLGGVRLSVVDAAAAEQAYDDLASLGGGEVLVEQMAGPGVDLIVGARRDPVFGPVVMVGVGGTATEVYADVAIASVPCARGHLVALPDQLRARALLDGHRGAAPVDREALADVLSALGDLLIDHPDLDEVEVNPLRAGTDGLVALDAVLVRAAVPPSDDEGRSDRS